MSLSSIGSVHDVPGERSLPPARHEVLRGLLEDVVADTHHSRRPAPGRRWRGPAMAAATLIAATVLVLGNVGTTADEVAHAATPEPLDRELAEGEPAGPALQDLADEASTAPAQAPQFRVRTENWWLSVSVHGEGANEEVTTAVVPVLRDVEFESSGAVRVREVQGEPQFPNQTYREAWDAQGNPDPTGTVLLDETMEPGERASAYPDELASDPDNLRRQLVATSPDSDDPATAVFNAVNEVHSEQAVELETRTTMLEMLAREPGVEYLGPTTDRADREALAFAADGSDTGVERRHVLLLNPDDGELLGYEEIVTGDTREMNVEAPAVVAYTTFH